ncbi:MAG TPA: cation transporter [Chthoniobacterales bacterium]
MTTIGQTILVEDLDRTLQTRAGRRVEYVSIAWTSLEAIIGVSAGIMAGSVALIGFGADSIIEVASSCVLLWWLAEGSSNRDRAAHRLVGACFFALAGYIALDASVDLLNRAAPRVSYFGIVYAAACVVVMPILARAKRRVAARLNSRALHADSHQSDICAYLSIILLLGLALNALLGWWWADPVAALCMLPIIIREGAAGLRGQPCSHAHF